MHLATNCTKNIFTSKYLLYTTAASFCVEYYLFCSINKKIVFLTIQEQHFCFWWPLNYDFCLMAQFPPAGMHMYWYLHLGSERGTFTHLICQSGTDSPGSWIQWAYIWNSLHSKVTPESTPCINCLSLVESFRLPSYWTWQNTPKSH